MKNLETQKMPSPDSPAELTGREHQLYSALQLRPLGFYEALTEVYFDQLKQIEITKLENRMKNLLNRMRRKFPTRIHFKSGRYFWV